MKNRELADLFDELADLLEIQGEQVFRVNSYRRAARVVKDLSEDIETVAAKGELGDLPGIGKGMAEKINEYLKDGKISLHTEMLASMPAGLPGLLKIPGMGPKKVALVWKELGVEDVASLKAAIDAGKLQALKGMGEKTAKLLLEGMQFLDRSSGRTPLGLALPLAEQLAEMVGKIRGVKRVSIAGSLRRGAETIGDLDLLCQADDGEKVIKAFTHLQLVKRVLAEGKTKGSVLLDRRDGVEIQADCRVVPAESFGAALQYFTGSKEHNVRLREIASKKKLKLNEYGLFDGEKMIAGAEEEHIYKKLGVPMVPPEAREDHGEFEPGAAENLICLEDIRGDLHMHTNASDGTVSAAEMAAAAHERGYEYIAITDHSKSSVIANGLSIDRMWRQIEKIRELNKKLDSVAILIGCECDILADGKLDYPDALLAACDLVVASVHNALKQDRKKVTARVMAAMDNPMVTILGHPTGRLINKREAMDLDMPAIVAHAAKTQTVLELNAAWQRLDLCDRHVRLAREAGVKLSIDTDAHSTAQLDQMRLGIMTARRGWLRAKDVINTLPLASLRKVLASKRQKTKTSKRQDNDS
jgi:DNA polymerase (family 10)